MGIYLIEAVGSNRVKIGTTVKNARHRIKELQTGCPFECKLLATIPGGRKQESDIHQRFSSLRLAGEWFEKSDEILTFFREATDISSPREFINGVPIMECRLIPPFWIGVTKPAGVDKFHLCCHISFSCVACDQENIHGYAIGVDGFTPQHRSSHCSCYRPNGYYIRPTADCGSHEVDPLMSKIKIEKLIAPLRVEWIRRNRRGRR